MATSVPFNSGLLAKFKADYFATPQSPFQQAYSKALLSTDASVRDGKIDAALKQYGYESLTQSQIDSISNPSSALPAATAANTPPSPPDTHPDTEDAKAWIFLAFTGSYNINSDGFPDGAIEVVVGTDGTLDFGLGQTPLKSIVLADDQNNPWVQWNATQSEWYMVQFTSKFDKALGSVIREIGGFHCVVSTDGKQINTPIKAQSTSLKPHHLNSEEEFKALLSQHFTWAGIAFAGLLMLGINRAKHYKESREAKEKEEGIYKERLEVIQDITRKGADIAAKESLKSANTVERKELHTRMREAIQNIVQKYYENPANAGVDRDAAASALTQECKTAAATVLRGWPKEIADGHPSKLKNEVDSYMKDNNLMATADRAKMSEYFSTAVDQTALKAFKSATDASGSPGAGLDAVAENYLQLGLLNHQLKSIGSRLQASPGNIAAADTALKEAKDRAAQKTETANTSRDAWTNLVDQIKEAKEKNQDTTALEEDKQKAETEYQAAKASAEQAEKEVTEKETEHQRVTKEQTSLKEEEEEGNGKRSKMEEETGETEKRVTEHLYRERE
ncbi:hypothetical protein F53441_13718 [Fusarium austroafricanum]|uniref:Uncharacterized protein n=1 Tax=Fusarium austroafricanum TaxID=2364996 RepID=A0A8H4NEB1_9HYPO|nr:hypothetical protein F53441_13718 [Fusarium austroafricanum]